MINPTSNAQGFSWEDHPRLREQIHAIIRIILVVTIILFFGWLGLQFFYPSDPQWLHDLYGANRKLYYLLRILIQVRFSLIPIATISFVLYAAARFIREIYGLRSTGEAFRFVLAALFSIRYPFIRVQKTKIVATVPENQELLEKVGGPGRVVIEADTVVLFQKNRSPSETSTGRGYFLSPFERIDRILSLEDQEGYQEKIETVSRDGIRVRLTDVRFRYRILPSDADGNQHVRSLQHPYSYSDEALRRIAYDLYVSDAGEADWNATVGKMLVGAISSFTNERKIDFLTAPREIGQDPRTELNKSLFTKTQEALKSVGAQLLWIDVGHIEIAEEAIDKKRVARWAAELDGEAATQTAYAEATRRAYKELGKAEAQAELMIGLTRLMKGIDLSRTTRGQFAALLLMRTTQILQEYSGDQEKED